MADKLLIETSRTIAVNAEHEKAKKDFITQKKIEKSKLLTDSRFSTMRARDAKMQELKLEVISKLATIAQDPKYRELLKFLIAEGLMTLLEHEVTLRCRKSDLALVEEELPKAVTLFKETMQKATGVVPTCTVTIDKENFLPPGPQKGQLGASWYVAHEHEYNSCRVSDGLPTRLGCSPPSGSFCHRIFSSVVVVCCFLKLVLVVLS